MIRYEYRLTVNGHCLGEQFFRLCDAESAAGWLAGGGLEPRIEYRRIDEPNVTEWGPLAWEDTLAGRLGHDPFPGYGLPVKVGESSD